MLSSLPGFIAMALVLAMSKISILSGLRDVFDLMIHALPIILVRGGKQVADLDDVSIVAGIVAGVLSVKAELLVVLSAVSSQEFWSNIFLENVWSGNFLYNR